MRDYWMGRRHTSELQRPHHCEQAFVASSTGDTRSNACAELRGAVRAQSCVRVMRAQETQQQQDEKTQHTSIILFS